MPIDRIEVSVDDCTLTIEWRYCGNLKWHTATIVDERIAKYSPATIRGIVERYMDVSIAQLPEFSFVFV